MYYVIYVGAGKESSTERYIEEYVTKDLYQICFHPVRHMKKKIHGKWVHVYERMIPGYVFVETTQEKISGFYNELKKIPAMTMLLGQEQNERDDTSIKVYPLSDKEAGWLRRISGIPADDDKNITRADNPIIELSQVGFDVNDQVVVLSGPLKEMKGQIKKIHLHKRMADVEVEFMGQKTVLHLGIELVEKDLDASNTNER